MAVNTIGIVENYLTDAVLSGLIHERQRTELPFAASACFLQA